MAESESLIATLTRLVNDCLIKTTTNNNESENEPKPLELGSISSARPRNIAFRSHKDATKVYDLLVAISQDPQSLQTYSINNFFKQFVLNIILELILSTQQFQKCCLLLKQFIDVDYNQEKRAFIRDELIELYGRVLVEIATWSHLGEMILEKSFFSNTGSDIELVDYEIESSASSSNASSSQHESESARKKRAHAVNECRDQQSLLALIKYILKTVDLVYILRRLSINKIHFRFLIVNFSLSPQASKVVEAMTSNFLDRSKLFKEEQQTDISDESEISDRAVHKHIMYTINEFYKSSMRSSGIFFSENKFNVVILDCVMQIHENIAAYVRGWMTKKSRKRTEWDKLMMEKVRSYALDLDTESNAKFRRLNFRLIYSYAKIIELYYGLISEPNKQKVTYVLYSAIKRVLLRLSTFKVTRNLEEDELKAGEQLTMTLMKTIISNKRIKLESVKNEFGYYFHEIIRSENDLLLDRFIFVLKLKPKRDFELIQDFTLTALDTIKREPEKLLKADTSYILLWSNLVLTLVECFVSESVETEARSEALACLVDRTRKILKILTRSNLDLLHCYLDFSIKIVRFIMNNETKFASYFGHLQALNLEMLDYIFHLLKFKVELEENIYLDILKFINILSIKKSKSKKFLRQYSLAIKDMLLDIKYKVDLENEKNNRSQMILNKLFEKVKI